MHEQFLCLTKKPPLIPELQYILKLCRFWGLVSRAEGQTLSNDFWIIMDRDHQLKLFFSRIESFSKGQKPMHFRTVFIKSITSRNKTFSLVFHGQSELQKSTQRAWKRTFEIKKLFCCFFSPLMQGEGIFQIKLSNGYHLLKSLTKVIIKINQANYVAEFISLLLHVSDL